MTHEQNNNDVFGMCMDALESSLGSPTLDLMTGENTSREWEEFSHHPNLKRLSAVISNPPLIETATSLKRLSAVISNAPEDDGANDEQQGQTLARGSGDIPVAIQLREIACTTSDKNTPGDFDQMEKMQATIAHQQAEMERMRAALQSSGICRDAMTKIAAQGQAVAHDTVNVQRASIQVAAQKQKVDADAREVQRAAVAMQQREDTLGFQQRSLETQGWLQQQAVETNVVLAQQWAEQRIHDVEAAEVQKRAHRDAQWQRQEEVTREESLRRLQTAEDARLETQRQAEHRDRERHAEYQEVLRQVQVARQEKEASELERRKLEQIVQQQRNQPQEIASSPLEANVPTGTSAFGSAGSEAVPTPPKDEMLMQMVMSMQATMQDLAMQVQVMQQRPQQLAERNLMQRSGSSSKDNQAQPGLLESAGTRVCHH